MISLGALITKLWGCLAALAGKSWTCPRCRVTFGPTERQITRTADGRCCLCVEFDKAGPLVPARVKVGARMGSRGGSGGGPASSPLSYVFDDYAGRVLSVTVVFDETSRMITGVTVFRDAACLWKRLLVGLGDDGSPDSTPRAFGVPAGTTIVPVVALNLRGLNTCEEFLAFQLTAGP